MLRPVILGPVQIHGLRRHLSKEFQEALLPAGMGGSCINSLIEARLRCGWKTDVITLDPGIGDDLVRLEGPLLRIWVVRRRKNGAIRDLFANEQRLLMLAVAEADPDLLHANWTYEYGLTAARQTRYPYVLTVHDHAWHCLRWQGWQYGVLYLITQYVLRRSRHLVAVSPYVGEYLEGIVRRTVPVIPNLVPRMAWELGEAGGAASRRGPGPKTGTVHIVSAINWSQLKNTRGALCAFSQARKMCGELGMDLKYTLLGPGLEPGGPAADWAKKHGYAKSVTFKGLVAHEEVLREIAGADVLFHPSHEESYGGPIAEAMAMRVPVVACREAGGSLWLCGSGRGLMCDGRNPRNMAERIVEACRLPQLSRCHVARKWLAGVAAEDALLDAWTLAYAQAGGLRV